MFSLQILVKDIVENPGRCTWGGWEGSLAVHFTPLSRLTIYYSSRPEEAFPEFPHTHMYDFRSVVVFGMMRERRYRTESEGGVLYNFQDMKQGEPVGEPGSCSLVAGPALANRPGEAYEISSTDIHAAAPDQGTVTFLQALGRTQPRSYRNFFLPDWDFAQQFRRLASMQMVEEACAFVLGKLRAPRPAA